MIVGVNLQEADDRARGFVERVWGGLPRGDGPARRSRAHLAHRRAVAGLPASYFIDATGVVRKVVWGLVREDDLAEGLSLILGLN